MSDNTQHFVLGSPGVDEKRPKLIYNLDSKGCLIDIKALIIAVLTNPAYLETNKVAPTRRVDNMTKKQNNACNN